MIYVGYEFGVAKKQQTTFLYYNTHIPHLSIAEGVVPQSTAFLPQLKYSPSLVFGRVRDSRPILLNGYPLRLFESHPLLAKYNRQTLARLVHYFADRSTRRSNPGDAPNERIG